MAQEYDLVIVGGGISGAALLYTTAKFTDIESIALIEKESEIAAINSDHTNNSQTLHFGDIETNYSLEKAENVKEGAEMLAGYLEHYDPERDMHDKRSKMVLGVGADEVAELEARYHEAGFGELYPKLRPIDREEIADLEPAVVEGRGAETELLALQTPDGYVVDYGATARSMVEGARAVDGVDVLTGTEVTALEETPTGYRFEATGPDGADLTFESTFAVVAAGSHSLQIAKELGYGEDTVLLPIAGSFFLAEDFLNGKVYTLQMKKLPFAAVHGDADVHDPSITRFGPTAKLVPTLERGRLSTVGDFLDVFGLNLAAMRSYASILADRILLPYVLKNLVYDLPYVGERAFLPHVRKVVPEADLADIERAEGYGGVRPQIVDTAAHSLDMGEAKIVGDDVIFNITPSPGASTSLKNAMRDARTITDELEATFDEDSFREATIGHFPRGEADAPVQQTASESSEAADSAASVADDD